MYSSNKLKLACESALVHVYVSDFLCVLLLKIFMTKNMENLGKNIKKIVTIKVQLMAVELGRGCSFFFFSFVFALSPHFLPPKYVRVFGLCAWLCMCAYVCLCPCAYFFCLIYNEFDFYFIFHWFGWFVRLALADSTTQQQQQPTIWTGKLTKTNTITTTKLILLQSKKKCIFREKICCFL